MLGLVRVGVTVWPFVGRGEEVVIGCAIVGVMLGLIIAAGWGVMKRLRLIIFRLSTLTTLSIPLSLVVGFGRSSMEVG